MSSLTYVQARDLMLGFFDAAWTPLGFPVVYQDIVSKPPTSQSVWAKIVLRHGRGFQSSLRGCDGTKRYTQEGVILIQVFAPVGSGIVAAYNAAQAVSNAYIDAISPDVWFKNVRLNEMGTTGAFEQVQVHVEFSYDLVR